jgi:threonine synthase
MTADNPIPDVKHSPDTASFPPEMDGASPNFPLVGDDADGMHTSAADASLPIHRRLAAFEDIVDSEVGDTLLTRVRNVERECGLRQLYVKFEGGNPTGTQKDRIAFAQAMDALRRGFESITVATCGNYGAALALASELAGLECFIFIPETFHSKRLEEILSHGATIMRTAGGYENAVDRSREHAEKHDVYDANPGSRNEALQLLAYGQIAYEIYDELRDAPAAVAVPVSNGTTLAGIHRGFLSLYRRGKCSRMPRFVAGSSFRKNPIVTAFTRGKQTCEDLPPSGIRETLVNEPLVNWRSIDGDAALEAIRSTGGSAKHVSDRQMVSLSRLLREREGLSILPASTAGLQALIVHHDGSGLPPDRYVAVLTGRKQ